MLFTSYRAMARVFKWLTLVLFAYVITAFVAHPDWRAVLHATFVPHIQWSSEYLSVLVAILGTTISPYLFFWQAAQEVEEERSPGRTTVAQRKGATDEGTPRRAQRRADRHVLFELRDVLHHPHHGVDTCMPTA